MVEVQRSGKRTVRISAEIECAVEESVVQHLQTELSARGLLLTADALREAKAEAARRGQSLLGEFITRCYGIQPQGGAAVSLQFESEEARAHIQAALAFGAAAAIALAPVGDGSRQDFRQPELLCAIFNLGIGLVDSLCDEDSETGLTLLGFLDGDTLMACAETPRPRGWLRTALSGPLAGNAAVTFAADLIELFFEELHAVFPGEGSWNRRRSVGRQLATALMAERDSVCWSNMAGGEMAGRERSLESSRLTSVLSLEIIETLARGSVTTDERSPGTLLGEALWRIDDLVDLCQDARSGALNSLLLRAMDDAPEIRHDTVRALERLLESTAIAKAAAEAAEYLEAGLRLVDGLRPAQPGRSVAAFLQFIQSYAGVPPATDS